MLVPVARLALSIPLGASAGYAVAEWIAWITLILVAWPSLKNFLMRETLIAGLMTFGAVCVAVIVVLVGLADAKQADHPLPTAAVLVASTLIGAAMSLCSFRRRRLPRKAGGTLRPNRALASVIHGWFKTAADRAADERDRFAQGLDPVVEPAEWGWLRRGFARATGRPVPGEGN
jgi:uncharacterized membrane protein